MIGASKASAQELADAEAAGREIAHAGAVLVSGDGPGVMEASCRGAVESGGLTLALLPGLERSAANAWVEVAVPTGLGELRNGLVIRTADAAVAVGGAYGTLSEIALALVAGITVAAVGSWEIEGVESCASPQEAVAVALAAARRSRA